MMHLVIWYGDKSLIVSVLLADLSAHYPINRLFRLFDGFVEVACCVASPASDLLDFVGAWITGRFLYGKSAIGHCVDPLVLKGKDRAALRLPGCT